MIEQRKLDHINICLKEEVEPKDITTGFEKYKFIYQSLPEIDKEEIDLSINFIGKKISAPLFILPMLGGSAFAHKINLRLAQAAQKYNLAMGVGSQRIAIENPKLEEFFSVRETAPSVLLFANFGAVQLNYGFGLKETLKAIKMIKADALCLHLNPLQELMQSGNINFSNLVVKIKHLCSECSYPILVKETGHGISEKTAQKLSTTGIRALDISGAGGTSWTLVEKFRTKSPALKEMANHLTSFAIPTAASLLTARKTAPNLKIVASGGIRSGVDIAKALALGADITGIARPFLKVAVNSSETLNEYIEVLLEELRSTMFAIGVKNIKELKRNGPHLIEKISS